MPRHPALCYASAKPKTRYPDRVAALLALADISRRDSSRRVRTEKRVYRCPSCRGFHLTGMKKRPLNKETPPTGSS